MSVDLTEMRHQLQLKRIDPRCENVDSTKRLVRDYRQVCPPVSSDDEMKFITRAVKWMVLASVTPLIVLLVVKYVYPELLWVPITPK